MEQSCEVLAFYFPHDFYLPKLSNVCLVTYESLLPSFGIMVIKPPSSQECTHLSSHLNLYLVVFSTLKDIFSPALILAWV